MADRWLVGVLLLLGVAGCGHEPAPTFGSVTYEGHGPRLAVGGESVPVDGVILPVKCARTRVSGRDCIVCVWGGYKSGGPAISCDWSRGGEVRP